MGILLREALTIMEDTERPFSIRFVSFDAARSKKENKCTKIFLPNCFQVGLGHHRKDNDTVGVMPVGRKSHPYPVHTHLILEVNGMEVIV